jgi:hypothetical protein
MIKLAEEQQAETKRKATKARHDLAKREAKKMGKTSEEYIVWYNSTQIKPKPPLRTQPGLDGKIEHIPAEESDTEWQLPSPPAPRTRKGGLERSQGYGKGRASSPNPTPRTPYPLPFEIEASDLAFMLRQTPVQIASRIQRRNME